MPEAMSSWRSLASSAGTRVKGYINSEPAVRGTNAIRGLLQATPQEDRQNWREWAGEKVGLRSKGNSEAVFPSTEIVSLFPGWAARRYAVDTGTEGASSTFLSRALLQNTFPDTRPFEVEAFISGFAVSHRSLANATRTQRTFIRLAKSAPHLDLFLQADISWKVLRHCRGLLRILTHRPTHYTPFP